MTIWTFVTTYADKHVPFRPVTVLFVLDLGDLEMVGSLVELCAFVWLEEGHGSVETQ